MKQLLIVACAFLVVPSAVLPQGSQSPLSLSRAAGTREFLSQQGDGASAPAAQIVFTHDSDGQLCVDLGIKRGPEAISKSFFSFSRVTTVAGERDEEPIKLEFPKKASTTESAFHIYSTCLDSDPYRGDSEKDVVRVMVRRPRKKPQTFFVDYPEQNVAWALNLVSTSAGMLESQIVVME